ncbi:MAG: hypothetical protein Q4B32_00980 [Clostridia bacterium]|nr:hypothetical protein [Clostridia bacterium]
MKRFVALLLTVVLCAVFTVPAMAVSFSFNSDTTTFTRWSADTTSVGSTWSLSWTSSNLSSSHKAAVKIYHAPGVYASHTFYYQSESTASHSYLPDYAGGQTVYLAGKRYSGTGNITVSGTFNP